MAYLKRYESLKKSKRFNSKFMVDLIVDILDLEAGDGTQRVFADVKERDKLKDDLYVYLNAKGIKDDYVIRLTEDAIFYRLTVVKVTGGDITTKVFNEVYDDVD